MLTCTSHIEVPGLVPGFTLTPASCWCRPGGSGNGVFPPRQGTRTEFLAPGISHCPAQAVAGIFGKNQRTGTLCLSVSPPCVCLTASQIKFLKKEKQGQLGGGSVRMEVPPLGVRVHYNGTRNSNCIFPGLQGPSHLCIAQSWLHRNP